VQFKGKTLKALNQKAFSIRSIRQSFGSSLSLFEPVVHNITQQHATANPNLLRCASHWNNPRTIATLTLKTKYDRQYNPPMVKFQCVKNEHPGKYGTRDRPAYVAMLGEQGEMIPLNAHRLQLFLMALA